jgi:hypothetical protein
MRFSGFSQTLAAAAWLAIAAVLAHGQETRSQIVAHPQIVLETQPVSTMHLENLPDRERDLVTKLPAGQHFFGAAKVGQSSDVETLTLRFEEGVTLKSIASTPDFKVEPGGSCMDGISYPKQATCTLLMRFTPQGPGPRLGRLTVSHTGAVEPLSLGINGYGTGPVATFTPAVITTVPGSYPSNAGLFSGATNIAVDDGDGVYVADTGNQKLWYLSSTGTFQSIVLAFGAVSLVGIAVDDFGRLFYTTDSPDYLFLQNYDQGTRYATWTGTCSVGSTCPMGSIGFFAPGALSYDHNGNVFADISHSVAKLSNPSTVLEYSPLANPYTYPNTGAPRPILVDTSDTTYYLDAPGLGYCFIGAMTYYDGYNSTGIRRRIAGTEAGCGFSGDGGEARNAEISGNVAQMAFDIAGNMYFSDTGNQRVRRIDAATGIITTVAGTGTAGYTGDGTPATTATLSNPQGVGVDSQGQVYILSATSSTAATQVLRKVGPNGMLSFGNQLRATPSGAKVVTVANSGNAGMVFDRIYISGQAAADYFFDSNTTTCNLTAGSILAAGQSCQIGIFFRPSVAGTRAASLVFLDNTVTQSNTVQLTGSGTIPAPTFAITAPATGTSVTAGTTVQFSVSVTSTTTPAPTGTVKFTLNGTAIGSPVTIASGAASVNVTGLTAGTATLAATYSGDSNFAAAGPISRTVTVTAASKASVTVTLSAKTNPASTCFSVPFTASVVGKDGKSPTGTVELKEGSKLLATTSIKNNAASFTALGLPAGKHTLTAVYLGDASYPPATSAAFTETVNQSQTCMGPVRGGRGPFLPVK